MQVTSALYGEQERAQVIDYIPGAQPENSRLVKIMGDVETAIWSDIKSRFVIMGF